MARSAERGRLLLALRVRSAWLVYAEWVLIAAAVGSVLVHGWGGRFYLGGLVALPVVLTHALHPSLKFFGTGVQFPSGRQSPHFLTWEKIARYSWDGDTLILTSSRPTFSEGGRIRIPMNRRVAVENILSMKVRHS